MKNKYKDMCYDCGILKYPEKRKDAFDGIGVAMGTCPVCKKKKGVIFARDWAYRAKEFEKWI